MRRRFALVLVSLLCLPLPGWGFSLSVPPPEATASTAMIQLANGIPGEQHEITVRLRSAFAIPSVAHIDAVQTNAQGTVEYFLSGQVIRFRSSALPIMIGTLTLKDISYQLQLKGLSKALAMIRWGTGTDITLEGLGLRGTATKDAARIANATRTGITMTTGTITVDGVTYRGAIDLAQQRVVLVGTFPMPKTGVAALDAQLAGKSVLLRIEAAPELVK